MRYFIDTEFIERPCTIDLISIGIVAQDGREFYGVSCEFDESDADDWVRDNVIKQLPPKEERITRLDIRQGLIGFFEPDPEPEFWGWYCDYDWVCFCWLFGRMIDLPDRFPMYCRDLKQMVDMHPRVHLLSQEPVGQHNAMEDAKWTRDAYNTFIVCRDIELEK